MSIYEFRHVSYTAPTKENGRDAVSIIENASFSIDIGVFCVIVGPSGAGKSTLLRLFNRLHDPSGGEILFEDKNILDYDVQDLRRRIGWMPQLPVRFNGTVNDNLELPFKVSKEFKYTRDEINKAIDAVKSLGLLPENLYRRDAAELSVGEAQRMCLLRALILKPDVLLLDEPTSALDRSNATLLLEQVQKIQEEWGFTVVLVSHRPDEVCNPGNLVLKIADRRVSASPCCQDGDHHV